MLKYMIHRTVLLLLSLFITGQAFSKEIFVSQKMINEDYNNEIAYFENSIQKAIKAAFDGDTIKVSSGFYDQDLLNIDKSIALIGSQAGIAPRNNTEREGGESVIINTLTPFNSLLINADNVVIDGFTFGDQQQSAFNSIYINAANTTIRNCVLLNAQSCGIYVSAHALNSQLAYNHLHNTKMEAILNTAKGTNILSNYISDVHEFAAISSSEKAVIKGNIISNVSGFGIQFLDEKASLSLVYGNVMQNIAQAEIKYEETKEEKLTQDKNHQIVKVFSINKELLEKSSESLVISNKKTPESLLCNPESSTKTINSLNLGLNLSKPPSFSIFNF
jgi:hypothetical protein